MAVTITGYNELRARFAAVSAGINSPTLMKALGGAAVREQAILESPHSKTGITRGSIRVGAITPTSVVTQVGGAGAFLEFGTKPHLITPKVARVLAWGGARSLGGRLLKGASATNFAMYVHHPGTRPYPFMVPGAQAAIQKSGANLIGAEIVNRWNGAA